MRVITDTWHRLEPITVILGFSKYSHLEKQSLISDLWSFLKVQGSNFEVQFSMDCVFPLIPPPGIDSWVQPRLNLVFSWVLNPANLGEPSNQVTQVSCVLEPSLPSLAGFIKTNKKSRFSWVCWVRCQNQKTLRAGFTGFSNRANPG